MGLKLFAIEIDNYGKKISRLGHMITSSTANVNTRQRDRDSKLEIG